MEPYEFTIETYNKGQVIFNQGEAAKCMYDIVEGRVGIYINYGNKNEKLLAELRKGEYLGEMGVIESQSRSATAVALVDGTSVKVITASNFLQFMLANPGKLVMILQNMSRRIHEANNNYTDACRTIAQYVDQKEHGLEISQALRQRVNKLVEKGSK